MLEEKIADSLEVQKTHEKSAKHSQAGASRLVAAMQDKVQFVISLMPNYEVL